MRIAIASGKGGTGKTTLAVNLAWFLASQEKKVRYLDCDVEEPNGHLFLNPLITQTLPAGIPVPVINTSKCAACGECVRFCQYRALIRLGKTILVYPELCHGCGGCLRVCPNHAITEQEKTIGLVESGTAGVVDFTHGKLNIGEAMSPPLIRRVLAQATGNGIHIIDAPPGTSCPVIASVRNADFTILVTEPTPFGLNDLGLALDMVGDLGLLHGVVINRAEPGNTSALEFCNKRGAEIIAEIPYNRRIAEAYSRGEMICDSVPGLSGIFGVLWNNLLKWLKP